MVRSRRRKNKPGIVRRRRRRLTKGDLIEQVNALLDVNNKLRVNLNVAMAALCSIGTRAQEPQKMFDTFFGRKESMEKTERASAIVPMKE